MQTKLAKFTLAAVVLAGMVGAAHAANQQPPAWGSGGTKLSSVPQRAVAIDGSGNAFVDAPTYKVFESSGSSSAVQVTDERGNAPVAGKLHMVCIDAGSNFTNVVDSNTTSGVSATSGNSLSGKVSAASGAETCQTYDVAFQTGLVVVNSDGTGASHVYWCPTSGCR